MKKEVAESFNCPFKNMLCDSDKCMAWVYTSNGKKEVARYKMPYDIYPRDEANRCEQLLKDGYVKEAEGFRGIYIKYEEAFEGHCSLINKIA